MSDITQCQDSECPSKEKCWRFTAAPTIYKNKAGETEVWQSYFSHSPRMENEDKCSYFWPNEDHPEVYLKNKSLRILEEKKEETK